MIFHTDSQNGILTIKKYIDNPEAWEKSQDIM